MTNCEIYFHIRRPSNRFKHGFFGVYNGTVFGAEIIMEMEALHIFERGRAFQIDPIIIVDYK